MQVKVFLALLAAFALLHQDTWLWNDGRLVFGFLPAGLAYHGGYSVVTAIIWALAIRQVWPRGIEAAATSPAEEGDQPN